LPRPPKATQNRAHVGHWRRAAKTLTGSADTWPRVVWQLAAYLAD
jgi:hypothetical protein